MDRDIIRRAAGGDEEAFRIIVEEYYRLVFAVIHNISEEYQQTENLVQETFLQVYRSLAGYRYKGFKTWITRIAVNKALDWKRSRAEMQRKREFSINDLAEKLSVNENPEDRLIETDELRRLKGAWGLMPLKYRKTLYKKSVRLMNIKQIAQEEGVSIRTVESRLYRARKMLKSIWKGDCRS